VGRVGERVGSDEGDERRRLAGARGRLQQRVPARPGRASAPHVRVLLRVRWPRRGRAPAPGPTGQDQLATSFITLVIRAAKFLSAYA